MFYIAEYSISTLCVSRLAVKKSVERKRVFLGAQRPPKGQSLVKTLKLFVIRLCLEPLRWVLASAGLCELADASSIDYLTAKRACKDRINKTILKLLAEKLRLGAASLGAALLPL